MSSKKRHQSSYSPVESKRKRIQALHEPPFDLYRDPSSPSTEEGLESIIKLLHGKKNIAVLLGAGISVSCGIPDFRTKGSGLYSTLNTQELGLSCPEELFEASFFNEDPRPFYKFARHLYFPQGDNVSIAPSDSHRLLAVLDQKKMLRRCYTQNIDGLEEIAGVSAKKIICAHGSLRCATCCKCKRKVDSIEIEDDIRKGTVAYCQAPSSDNNNRKQSTFSSNVLEMSIRASSRKRTRPGAQVVHPPSHNIAIDGSGNRVCGGVMKPNITFFGESLGLNVKRCLEADRNKIDALIVIGTSLSVAPISKVVGYLPPNIPRILINRTIVHPKHTNDDENVGSVHEADFRQDYVFDAYLLGYCDDVNRVLATLLFPTTSTSTSCREHIPLKIAKSKCKLLATLQGDDEDFNAGDWMAATKVPFERVFLFPGAQTPVIDYINNRTDFNEPLCREVVFCDGCAKKVVGTVQKCVLCFDYDLCLACYPSHSATHYDGTHRFVAEVTASEK